MTGDLLGGPGARERLSVSVVVPTWQRAKTLGQCLAALASQQRPPDEVIVVGRREDTEAFEQTRVARGSFAVRWVEVDRPGHIAPIKEGLAKARGTIVAFIDDDATPEVDWLDRLLQAFTDPGIACVGGRVMVPSFSGKAKHDAGQIRWYGRHIGNLGALEGTKPTSVRAVVECNWAWRRAVLQSLEFDAVLDFDDASSYGLDLCLQAAARGHHVLYHPQARVLHHLAPRDARLDRADRARRSYSYSRNYSYIAVKHFPLPQNIAFLLWSFAIGERGSYGVVAALADIALRGPTIRQEVFLSFAGKLEGIRLAWRRKHGFFSFDRQTSPLSLLARRI